MAKKGKSKQDVRPMADGDRQVALKAALDRIEKDFGKGAVLTLGDTSTMEIDTIPTGALSLDVALGIGG
ncbi:MAG: DNA recombination/repair protein RecA, partial [Saccharofermentanales bacterium]